MSIPVSLEQNLFHHLLTSIGTINNVIELMETIEDFDEISDELSDAQKQEFQKSLESTYKSVSQFTIAFWKVNNEVIKTYCQDQEIAKLTTALILQAATIASALSDATLSNPRKIERQFFATIAERMKTRNGINYASVLMPPVFEVNEKEEVCEAYHKAYSSYVGSLIDITLRTVALGTFDAFLSRDKEMQSAMQKQSEQSERMVKLLQQYPQNKTRQIAVRLFKGLSELPKEQYLTKALSQLLFKVFRSD